MKWSQPIRAEIVHGNAEPETKSVFVFGRTRMDSCR